MDRCVGKWSIMRSLNGFIRLVCCCIVVSAVSACQKKAETPAAINWEKELAPGQMALRKIPIGEYPNFAPAFASGNLRGVAQSIDNSLSYLSRASSKNHYPYLDITHDRAVATLVALKQIIDARGNSPADRNRIIHEDFEVYRSVGGWDGARGGFNNRVLFTGYFTPIYDASLTRSEEYAYPLYKRPTDLVSDTSGNVQGRRLTDGQIVPFYTRQQITTQNVLAGQELVWLKSKWEAYVITVQGSARLRLRDGQVMEVGYAGNNGYEYTSPGMKMVEDGVIRREELNVKRLGQLIEGDPQLADKYLSMNQRYVFFAPSSGGPYGSINVPVTPMASLATDKQVYPRAMPAFLNTTVPGTTGTPQPFKAFMLDQDTGGAIRAAGRADIYMGVGPDAERLAGYQLHEGELYYLAVKPELIPKYLPAKPPAAVP